MLGRSRGNLWEVDLDEDGVLDSAELKAFEIEADELKDIDINDGTVEFREALQLACTCDNELISVFDQFVDGRGRGSFGPERYDWENSYDFESVDANRDEQINEGELELLMVICETTHDAFDGDGDGVPDDVDASWTTPPSQRTRTAMVWATTLTS